LSGMFQVPEGSGRVRGKITPLSNLLRVCISRSEGGEGEAARRRHEPLMIMKMSTYAGPVTKYLPR
jgi:hypothetical protein